MTLLALAVIAMVVATEDIEAIRDDLLAACKKNLLSDEEIADLLGIGRGQFGEQKALRQHLSLWRLTRLPRRVQVDFWKIHGKRIGLVVIDDWALGEYLTERVERFRKRQLKMALAAGRAERTA